MASKSDGGLDRGITPPHHVFEGEQRLYTF